ncbi:hypothetical protein KI387_010286, partial [Taxus chinensis]
VVVDSNFYVGIVILKYGFDAVIDLDVGMIDNGVKVVIVIGVDEELDVIGKGIDGEICVVKIYVDVVVVLIVGIDMIDVLIGVDFDVDVVVIVVE